MDKKFDIDKILSDPNQNDKLDAVIADAMNRLSVRDREKIVHEVHGVSEGIEETTEFVAEKLESLQQELCKLKKSRRLPTAALELAETLSPAFVGDRKFRLAFLRSDDFDARLAAERMVKYFDFKFSLFGSEKLCKDITSDDLDQSERDAIDKGFMQWLPERDRGGRPVAIFFPSEQEYSWGCDIGIVYSRIVFYHYDMMSDDEVMSRKGLVVILYNVGPLKIRNLYSQVPPIFSQVLGLMPARMVSVHACFNNLLFRLVVQNVLSVLGQNVNAAAKVHQGSQQEVRYSLMTYGIPTDLLPVNADNGIKKNNWREIVKAVKKKEEYSHCKNEHACYILPFVNDVLFGKGGPSQDRPGNVRLKMQIDELLPLYNTLDKAAKIELGKQVVETVKETGGRFLSKESGVFMEVSDDLARSKVAHLFRNRRKALQNAAKKKAAVKTSLVDCAADETASSLVGKRARI